MERDQSPIPEARPEIRGVSAYGKRASRARRLGAFALDLAWMLALVVAVLDRVRWPLGARVPAAVSGLFLGIAAATAIYLLQKKLLRRTPGLLFWGIALKRDGAFVLSSSGLASALFASILTLAAWSAPAWLALELVEKDALWSAAGMRRISPAPTERSLRLSFFYTIADWPTYFDKHPVFFSLPYKKGPPDRFVDEIVARWKIPDLRVTIEGPKTPAEDGARHGRETIRRCLLAPALTTSTECIALREQILGRHLREIQETVGSEPSSLQWFEADRVATEGGEPAQGFYLSASGPLGERSQERYVLIGADGIHQTFVLDHAGGPSSERAHALLEGVIGGMEVFTKLAPGRLWSERTLAEAATGAGRPTVEGVAREQAALVARVSVEPKDFDAYFKLGESAMRLTRILARNSGGARRDAESASALQPRLVHNAYRFAKDVAPRDPRTKKLEHFWYESKKY